MGNRALLSVDVAKAFDSVEWPFLLNVLAKFVFGPTFTSWVQLLYSHPLAAIGRQDRFHTRFLRVGVRTSGMPSIPIIIIIRPSDKTFGRL